MMKRRAPLILSLTFFLSSLAALQQTNTHFTPDRQPVPEVAQVVQERTVETLEVTGVWEQYGIDEEGQRHFMARLDMQRHGTSFIAIPTDVAENVFPKHAYSSFDHRYENGYWSFREDWDDGQVGQFILKRQPNGEFLGTATSVDGVDCFETVFIRIED